MKKGLLFTLAILTVMAMLFAAPASPAAAKGGEKSITLIAAQYIPNKGVVFKFKVQGDFGNFNGVVFINGQEFNLNCILNEFGDLVCVTDQGLKNYIGQVATAVVNGHTSSASIRGAAAAAGGVSAQYCYPVFDEANVEGGSEGEGEPGLFVPLVVSPVTPWEQAGTYCQDAPANVGDQINWYNPAYDGFYDYLYSLDGEDTTTNPPDLGPGYYWEDLGESTPE